MEDNRFLRQCLLLQCSSFIFARYFLPRNKGQISEFIFPNWTMPVYLLWNEHRILISLHLTSSVFFNSGNNGKFSLWSIWKVLVKLISFSINKLYSGWPNNPRNLIIFSRLQSTSKMRIFVVQMWQRLHCRYLQWLVT